MASLCGVQVVRPGRAFIGQPVKNRPKQPVTVEQHTGTISVTLAWSGMPSWWGMRARAIKVMPCLLARSQSV